MWGTQGIVKHVRGWPGWCRWAVLWGAIFAILPSIPWAIMLIDELHDGLSCALHSQSRGFCLPSGKWLPATVAVVVLLPAGLFIVRQLKRLLGLAQGAADSVPYTVSGSSSPAPRMGVMTRHCGLGQWITRGPLTLAYGETPNARIGDVQLNFALPAAQSGYVPPAGAVVTVVYQTVPLSNEFNVVLAHAEADRFSIQGYDPRVLWVLVITMIACFLWFAVLAPESSRFWSAVSAVSALINGAVAALLTRARSILTDTLDKASGN